MYDILETVSNSPILVEAEVTLYKTEDGGKESSITKSYRPNHNFDWPQNKRMFIGQIELKEDEWMNPGETKILNITFMDAKGLREVLAIGRTWKIQEGSHIVGEATVKYIVSESF